MKVVGLTIVFICVLAQGLGCGVVYLGAGAGGSGSLVSVAILVEKEGKLVNLIPDVAVPYQSEYRIWNEPAISDTALVVTADYLWGEVRVTSIATATAFVHMYSAENCSLISCETNT